MGQCSTTVSRRSGQSNRWYWGYTVRPLWKYLKEEGLDPIVGVEDIHDHLKNLYRRRFRLKRSAVKTHTMTSKEFEVYQEWVRAELWHRLGLSIKLPGD